MQVIEGTTLDSVRPAPSGQGQLLIAVASLLGCGALLALSTNLAKVANGFGIEPLPFLTWSLAGATLLLSAVALFRGQRPAINRRSIEYYVLAGFLSVAGANLIFFNAVPRVGVSFGRIDGVAETYSHACTKEHYYRSVMHVDGQVRDLNPSRLVPVDMFTHKAIAAIAYSDSSTRALCQHPRDTSAKRAPCNTPCAPPKIESTGRI